MPKIAAIHDLAGLGRTSLNAVIPILTTLGAQVCPMPTAVLSSGTEGFKDFHFCDLTPNMREFLNHWKEIPMSFDAVYSGFLGSPAQVEIVAECARDCMIPGGLLVVDPVLGDHGKLEPTMGMEMVESMRWLASQAKCITPNLTEAALLLNKKFPAEKVKSGMPNELVIEWLIALTDLGPDISVITSVPRASRSGNEARRSTVMAYDKIKKRVWRVECDYIPAAFPGTGDIYTSVLTGSLLRGDSLPEAMDRAVQFVTLAIRATFGYSIPEKYGVKIERVLTSLSEPLRELSYTLVADFNGQ